MAARPTPVPARSPQPPPERAEGPVVSNPIRDDDVPDASLPRDSLDLHHRETLVVLPLTGFLEVATFVLFLVRVRRRIHTSLGRVAKRFGLALCAFSVAVTTAKISLLSARRVDDATVATELAFPLSCAAFVAHVSMTLPYPRTRSLWVHLAALAVNIAAKGLYCALLKEWLEASFYGIVWPLLFARSAQFVRTLRSAVQKMSLAQGSRASSVGLVSLVSGLPPVLYLAANSGACLLFVDSPSETCDTRLQTNYALSLVFILFGLLPILLVLEPVNLQQVMHLELPRSHLVAAGFGACSFVCVVALAGTRERFGPLPPAILGIASGAYTFALLCILALGAGVVDRASKPRLRARVLMVLRRFMR